MGEIRYALVALMDERKMSQTELCRETGIPSSTMSGYVHGRADMSAQSVIKIAKALGVTTDRLLGTGFDSAEPTDDSMLDRLLGLYAVMDSRRRSQLLDIAEVIAR